LPVIEERFRAAFQAEEELDRQHQYRTSEVREVERWRNIVSNVLTDVANPQACFRELFKHFARPASWKCNPDAQLVLGTLRGRRVPLAIASNYDHRLRSVVAGTPAWRGLGLVISSEVGWRKPAAQFFLALCQTLGAQPPEVLYIGDDLTNDYGGAGRAGLQRVLFDPRGRGIVPNRIASLLEILELLA
jgi:putative hydrolase of the HAD superfamily